MPDEIAKDVIEAVPEKIMSELISEKSQIATMEIDKAFKETEMVEEFPETYVGRAVVDLGDNCYVRIEMVDAEDPSLIEKVGNVLCPSAYAKTSKSGHSIAWKKYGNRYYTAKAEVFCGVAYGKFALENHYKLSSSGITERYGTAWSEDSGILNITEGTPQITTSKATTIGKSTCITCTYKGTYCVKDVRYSNSYKMKARVKYVARDTIENEIQVNQNWDFNQL